MVGQMATCNVDRAPKPKPNPPPPVTNRRQSSATLSYEIAVQLGPPWNGMHPVLARLCSLCAADHGLHALARPLHAMPCARQAERAAAAGGPLRVAAAGPPAAAPTSYSLSSLVP
mmetsp:Transcript_34395/g.86955  ORF Transcript_34395/g.86955 Transcript_34395/m.86955 type:complete len:115 (+) Transcript_34395:241-585(+)